MTLSEKFRIKRKEAKQGDLIHITDSSNRYPRNVPLDLDKRSRILQHNEAHHRVNSRNSF